MAVIFSERDPATFAGAVNNPVVEIVPTLEFPPWMLFTDHITPVLLVPVTVAVNCLVRPACTVTGVGATETEIVDVDETTFTVALADLVGSALLTAVRVTSGLVGAVVGAV